MSAQPIPESLIVSTPGFCSGKPRIAGTRIRVQDIAVMTENFHYSPDEIVFHYSHLDLPGVHAALSYFYAHRLAILQDMDDEERTMAEFKEQNPDLFVLDDRG